MPSLGERWNKLGFAGKSIVGLTAVAAIAAVTILSLGAAGVIAGGALGAFETVGSAIASNYIPVVAGAGGLAVGLGAGAVYSHRRGKSGRSGVSSELSHSNENGQALAPKLQPEQVQNLNLKRDSNFADRAKQEEQSAGYVR